MRIVVVIAAVGASLLAFLMSIGAGLALAGIGESGARGPGLVLAAISLPAFVSVLFLAFAPRGFLGGRRKPLAAFLVLVGLLPVAAIGGAALFFAGNPLSSQLPFVDWGAFGIGLFLAIGALAIVALGLGRTAESVRRPAEPLHEGLGVSAPNEQKLDRESDLQLRDT